MYQRDVFLIDVNCSSQQPVSQGVVWQYTSDAIHSLSGKVRHRARKERPVYSEPKKKNKKEENAECWLLIIITRNGLIRLCLEIGIRGFVCSQFHKD